MLSSCEFNQFEFPANLIHFTGSDYSRTLTHGTRATEDTQERAVAGLQHPRPLSSSDIAAESFRVVASSL